MKHPLNGEPQCSAPKKAGDDNRILIISRLGCPPPIGGNRTRMVALLREMRRLGYEIHFAGVRMPATEKTATRPLVDQWVWDFAPPPPPAGFARLRASLAYHSRQLLRRFHLVLDRLDDPFCEHWLAEARALQQRGRYSRVLVPYVYHSKFFEAFPDPCLKILDTLDAFSNSRQRLHAQRSVGYLRYLSPEDEKRGLLRARRVLAIQEREAEYFRQLVGAAARVFTVGHFAEDATGPSLPAPFLRLGCIGSSTGVNLQGLQWFLREVWPEIRQRLPQTELWVAGGVGGRCAPAPGLRLLGQIPSLADFYRDCPVLINPVRTGTGLKIKTIEALLQGRPIVATSVGAEGLESFIGRGLFVGDSPKEFAQSVVNLLSNLSQAQLLGEAALRHAQDYVAENRRVFAQALAIG